SPNRAWAAGGGGAGHPPAAVHGCKRGSENPRCLRALRFTARENLVRAPLDDRSVLPRCDRSGAGSPMGRSDEYRRYAAECLEMRRGVSSVSICILGGLLALLWQIFCEHGIP